MLSRPYAIACALLALGTGACKEKPARLGRGGLA